ncbi:hypothetical protein HUJ05_007460 [Dendroctonus ponderosae]|nr:hypothetical protein HUJ05_007452 [Dendroctonus ponderosae]KAH1006750.1 hypothetical protein HUJ05_007455 [Dendroctonus ponderosae]KAH1006755.1 hypothetical protein HUJ05_007460 [Dendroctonus ponderosae]
MADQDNVEKTPDESQESPAVAEAAVKEKTSSEISEYDSVDSYSDDDEQPIGKARSKASGLDSQSETEDCAALEREEGDGQESVPQKKVDDDEDKKNPQYIPKRGTFYEHDDRTAEDLENQEEAEPEKVDKDGKKKIWDKEGRWGHDRFNDQEQSPKSPSELIAIYGYDIRNEEGPPKARRRRRYGRGPNKYTRNWEDEDAYGKPVPARPPKPAKKERPRNSEEFPPLGANSDRARLKSPSDSNGDNIEAQENNMQASRASIERQDPKKEQAVEQNQPPASHNPNSSRQAPEQRNLQPEQGSGRFNQPQKVGTGRIIAPKKEIKDSDYKGFTTKTRQQRSVRSENQKVLPPRNLKKENEYIQSQNFSNKNSNQNQIAEMEREISSLNIQDGVYKGKRTSAGSNNNNKPNANNQNRQGSVPPRLQNSEPKGSKRYSSLRQRSLPETNAPPVPANFSFYPNGKHHHLIKHGGAVTDVHTYPCVGFVADYNSAAPPPATQQPILPSSIPPAGLVPPQVPVSAAPPLLQAPFPAAAAFAAPAPPQAFLQGPPPPFIAAPPAQPQLVSYVTQAQPAFVQGYQGQFNAVTQPADLYQPQGGITYYSADQQIAQRPVPLRRPKAAIPIVAPTNFKDQIQRDDVSCSTGEATPVSE